MNPTTKIYAGYQTVIPLEIRKKLNITHNHVLEWTTTKEGEAKITFKKKKSINDIIGIAHSKEPTNAVEMKKKIQRGDDKF
jgi:bifunctional DNA-binding transcriptional regulator/antitoxin component of YhaV-PrlF toxin-antitoxin module